MVVSFCWGLDNLASLGSGLSAFPGKFVVWILWGVGIMASFGVGILDSWKVVSLASLGRGQSGFLRSG